MIKMKENRLFFHFILHISLLKLKTKKRGAELFAIRSVDG